VVQAPTLVRLFRARRRALASALLAAGVALSAVLPAGAESTHLPEAGRPALPDLRVSYTNVIAYNGALVLLFKVWNAGTALAGRFTVVVEAANGAVLEVFPAPGLQAGYSVAFEHTLPACVPSAMVVRTIVVDSGDYVPESVEANNETKAVHVYGPTCSSALAAADHVRGAHVGRSAPQGGA
jgi:hypothetical protein